MEMVIQKTRISLPATARWILGKLPCGRLTLTRAHMRLAVALAAMALALH